MKLKEHKIDGIEPGSIAEEMGIEAGDVLLEVMEADSGCF